jgi:hypothetical protein
MIMNRQPISFDDVVARAREISGLTPAEFDYSLTTGDLDTRAIYAIGNACYELANADPATPTTSTEAMRRRLHLSDELHSRMVPHIKAMIEAAKAKSYLGWSIAGSDTGPVRYAPTDESDGAS